MRTITLAALGGAMAAAQAQQPWSPTAVFLPDQPQLEAKAVDLLQRMSATLAAARTLSFTSVATYESPARTGQPLAYMVKSEVALERPDQLRVLALGDGPRSEFYYDGKTVMAYTPSADMVAVAQAPATIDQTLKAAYDFAAIYFPFTDVIVADPWRDLEPRLRLAFYMGQSKVVGGTRTDIVVIASDTAQAQIWIGDDDHLPRRIGATYFQERGNYRHDAELSDWKIDPRLAAGSFSSEKAENARHIPFAPPA
ncbi:MAG: DUF2092 domain-containing protein [Geminicoccaceae bacterium]